MLQRLGLWIVAVTFSLTCMAPVEASHHPGDRDYFAEIPQDVQGDINYIINTLANTGSFGLAFKRSKLVRRGNNTAGVHPLSHLAYVFSHPDLKHQVNRIGGTAWHRYKGDFAESLATSAERGNIKDEYITDFATRVGIEEDKIKPLIEKGEWYDFIELLVRHVDGF